MLRYVSPRHSRNYRAISILPRAIFQTATARQIEISLRDNARARVFWSPPLLSPATRETRPHLLPTQSPAEPKSPPLPLGFQPSGHVMYAVGLIARPLLTRLLLPLPFPSALLDRPLFTLYLLRPASPRSRSEYYKHRRFLFDRMNNEAPNSRATLAGARPAGNSRRLIYGIR